MAESIVYNYEKMNNTASKIREIEEKYKTAGTAFVESFVEAIANWEGESKDKVQKLIQGSVSTMLTNDIPSYLEGLASLLEQNVKQMQKADNQIAESIPDNLG